MKHPTRLRRGRAGQARWITLAAAVAVILTVPCAAFPDTEAAPGPPAQGPVFVVDLTAADPATILTVECLQGLVNRTAGKSGEPAIYVIRNPEDDYWLAQYTRDPQQISPQDLIAKFKDRAAGQILYDPEKPFTAHIALAAAGALDAIATPADLGIETILDCRREWRTAADAYRWAVGNLLRRCNREKIGVVDPAGDGLRDYFVKARIFVLALDPQKPDEARVIEHCFRRMPTGIAVIGPPALRDNAWAGLIQRDGHSLVPCSPLANLSFHSAFDPAVPLSQPERYVPPGKKSLVAFAYLGGEDLAFAFRGMAQLWMAPGRGMAPIGWTLSPALLDLAPAVLQRYYAEAALSGSDQFVMAPNGADVLPLTGNRYVTEVLRRTRDYAERADLTVMAVSDPGSGSEAARALERCALEGGIQGLLPLQGTAAQSALYANTPAVAEAVRATTPHETLQAIRQAAERDKYIFVAVPPDALSPTEIAAVASRLGEEFEVVGPLDLIAAARHGALLAAVQPAEGALEVAEVTLSPETPGPTDQVALTARMAPGAQAQSARLIYTIGESPVRWAERMSRLADGSFVGLLPPILHGGMVKVQVQAVGAAGEGLSRPLVFEVRAPDADADGLTDADEALFRSDPGDRDTDGDGLSDGNDPDPLRTTVTTSVYLPPILPPGDGHVLVADEGSAVAADGRQVTSQAHFTYRLPLDSVPQGASAVLTAVASGQPVLSVSSDGETFTQVAASQEPLPGATPTQWPIPSESLASGALYLRFETAAEAAPGATLHSVSIGTSPDGPSITLRGLEPGYLAPGVRSSAVAKVWDPDGIESVALLYRVGGGAPVARPMKERGTSQVYAAQLPELASGNWVAVQVRATDKQGHTTVCPAAAVSAGVSRAETISLLGGRDFEGEMRPWPASGAAWRWGTAGQADRASPILLGGRYVLWLLAAPRGAGLHVAVDGQPLAGAIKPDAPDGWQRAATLDLAPGKHEFSVFCGPGGPKDALRGYAQLLLSTDSKAAPPGRFVLDQFNTISIISPSEGETVERRVTVRATATGNVVRADCYVDGELIGRERLPPYEFRWDTSKWSPGEHKVEVRAINGADEAMLSAQITVKVAR